MSWGLGRVVRRQWSAVTVAAAGGGQRPCSCSQLSVPTEGGLWSILWGGEREPEEVQAAACNEVLQ